MFEVYGLSALAYASKMNLIKKLDKKEIGEVAE